MKKMNLNAAIDVVAFIAFVLLTSTGILIHFILPPGSGHFSSLWGMDRHDWGLIHFWIAVVLMCSLALHLLLHWKWIICTIKGRPQEGSGIRMALAVVGVIAMLVLAATPFFADVEQSGEPPHKLRSTQPGAGYSNR